METRVLCDRSYIGSAGVSHDRRVRVAHRSAIQRRPFETDIATPGGQKEESKGSMTHRMQEFMVRAKFGTGVTALDGSNTLFEGDNSRHLPAVFRLMQPMEFLARLAALIAPPRYPLVRYAGVLGPHSAWRKDIVPRPREPARAYVEHGAKSSAPPSPRTQV